MSQSVKVALVLVVVVAPVFAGHTLTTNESKILNSWLAQHRQYRLATDADCDCADDITQMRSGYGGTWKGVPDYSPYVATGDFNGDGVTDFAVVVIDRSKSAHNFALVVFNGPFGGTRPAAPYVKSGLDLQRQGLAYGPPRPKPYRLVVGPFESEGAILTPHGRTYVLENSDCC